ncbi:hypothetical protein FACS189426_04200 [Bacteroidia bacterium]|nr:hypothetical protein FACS189426_04200 [Bacteroidia bacterium]
MSLNMKSILFTISILIMLSISSCNKQKKQFSGFDFSQIEEIVIDTRGEIMLPIDSFVEKMDYVKLETTDNNLIGDVSQLLFSDSLLIVVDSEIAKSISV